MGEETIDPRIVQDAGNATESYIQGVTGQGHTGERDDFYELGRENAGLQKSTDQEAE